MSDAKQPEHMRPIPDGGLKDAMPSWLKRPPAWRDLPTAGQRHERSLPEPDTSEIDPRSLVDVSDLPQWLQAIAARGEINLPEPDAAVDHAVEIVQAAHKPDAMQSEPAQGFTPFDETGAAPDSVGPGFMPAPDRQSGPEAQADGGNVVVPESEPPAPVAVAPSARQLAVPVWILAVAVLVFVALLVLIAVLI